MYYPMFSFDDGTEVTASKPDENGRVLLYIEKFDKISDEFINATFALPDMELLSSHGYNKQEIEDMAIKLNMNLKEMAKRDGGNEEIKSIIMKLEL